MKITDSTLSPLKALNDLKSIVVDRLLEFTGSQKFLTVQLDITNACNLTCAHCYHPHHSNRGSLDISGWHLILDEYAALLGLLRLRPHFIICGGEPILSPLFMPIVRTINTRWPDSEIIVLTNGTMLTGQFAAAMKQFKMHFQISLDGPDSAKHDNIRGAGSFSQSLQGLSNLQAVGLNASFLATLSHKTWPWIPEFFKVADQMEVVEMNFTRFIPEGTGKRLFERNEDRPLAPHELQTAYTDIIRGSRESGVSTNTDLPLFHLINSDLGANGKVGFQGLVIDYQGNLKVTSRSNVVLGNILDNGLATLFLDHPTMRALRNREIEGCGQCPHYAVCGGDRNAAYSATGSFLKKDPGCWFEVVNSEVA